jgi:GR25 family glycosyltransferase involved in LPS biosynthesis
MSHYIDEILYLNLERRRDRRQDIENELNKFGLHYKRVIAIDTPSYGCYGCSLSHLHMLKYAKEMGYKNVMILEDDFQFLVDKEEFENKMRILFEQKPNFDVCMLSAFIQKVEPDTESNPNFRKIVEASASSGYIIQSHYYDKLIGLFEWSFPLLLETHMEWIYTLDQVWKRLQVTDNWVTFEKLVGKQRPGFSDCGNAYSNNDWS